MAQGTLQPTVIRSIDETLRAYQDVPEVAFDLETGGLRPDLDPVHVVSLAAIDRPPAVLHVRGYLPPELLDLLRAKRLVGHNLTTFDVPFVAKYGLTPDDLTWDDTLILEQLSIVTNRRGVSRSLQASIARRTGKRIEKNADHAAWANETLDDQQVRYCADDVSHVLDLRGQQLLKIADLGAIDALDLERRTHRAIAWMTVNGVPLDTVGLLNHTETAMVEAGAILEGLRTTYDLANPGSPVQVKAVITDRFGLRLASTNHETLTNLELRGDELGRFCRTILAYRALLKSAMYNREWLDLYAPNGVVHPRYWQLGTDTGRMSCSDPNIQQWPSRMRRYVLAPEGSAIVSADFSQLEVVVGAVLYRDPELLRAVESSDVHTTVAALIFDRDPDDPEVGPGSRLRKIAKAASFTFLFDGGLPGMQRATLGENIPDDQLMEAKVRFFQRFPVVAKKIRAYRGQVERAKMAGTMLKTKPKMGPVRGLFGLEITSQRLCNSLIQGSAASVMKQSLVRMVNSGLGPYLSTAIHDEAVLVVPVELVTEVSAELEKCMRQAAIDVINHRVDVKVRSGRTLAD